MEFLIALSLRRYVDLGEKKLTVTYCYFTVREIVPILTREVDPTLLPS